MKNSGKLMGYLSAAGLVAALGLVASNLTAKPALFFFDTISVDALSQFFKVVFLIVSLLVVIASCPSTRERAQTSIMHCCSLPPWA